MLAQGFMPADAATIQVPSLRKISAAELYVHIMKNNGHVPKYKTKPDGTAANVVFEMFGAMATEEERGILRAPETGLTVQAEKELNYRKKYIKMLLNALVARRLRKYYEEADTIIMSMNMY